MRAIYKREVRAFFHSFVGWLYLAVMFAVMGLYFVLSNMLVGYPTLSYMLQMVIFLVVFTIPVLTMRSLSEEKKYKTDQLILTSPVSVWGIVWGKYLALVTVFAIPLAVFGLTPPILMTAGRFQAGLSYTSLLGFFLYGCLGLAVGLFLSSLTESVVISAVLTLAVMYLGYVMAGLCSLISSFGKSALADIVVRILGCFDMVGRFDALCSGYFQIGSVVYYVTAVLFLLFCTVQSIQKRRYAMAGRGRRIGAYSIFHIVVGAALTVLVNWGVTLIPDQYTAYDITVNDMFTLSDETKQLLTGLTQDVTVYVLNDENAKDVDLDRTLQQISSYSGHIRIEYINPMSNPKFYYKYTEVQPATNSLIVEGAAGSTVVDYTDIYLYSTDYYTGESELVGYDGEGQIVSAIARVSLDGLPKFYTIVGHNERPFDDRFLGALRKENIDCEDLALYTVDAVPDDAYGVILNAPVADYSEDDVQKILDFLDRGGNALIIPTWTDVSMSNFEQILAYYGVSLVDGVIVEGDRNYYYQSPLDLFPAVEYTDMTASVYNGTVFAPDCRGLLYDEDSEDIRYQALLRSSDASFSKADIMNIQSEYDLYRQGEGDAPGPFVIALEAEKPAGEQTSLAVIVATEQMFTAEVDDFVPGYNMKLFGSMMAALADRDVSVSIPVKYYEIGNLAFSSAAVYVTAALLIFVVPIGCLAAGGVIWFRRRRK